MAMLLIENDGDDDDDVDPSYDLVSISLSPLLHPDFTGIGTMHCPALRSKHSNDLKLYQ